MADSGLKLSGAGRHRRRKDRGVKMLGAGGGGCGGGGGNAGGSIAHKVYNNDVNKAGEQTNSSKRHQNTPKTE